MAARRPIRNPYKYGIDESNDANLQSGWLGVLRGGIPVEHAEAGTMPAL